MRGYPHSSFWISITLVKIYIFCIIINRGKNTFELVGTVLNKSKVVQRCLYSYRQRYSSSQWSKYCGLRSCSEQFASRGQKYQTCLILSSRPRKANFSPKFSRTREETDEQTASRWSMLSSFITVCGRLK